MKRTLVSDSIEIQFNPTLLKYAADIDPSQDYDLFLRLCWIFATTIGHELIHVINYIRFHDTESGHDISLEDEYVIWNSRQNKQCEDGFAWEVSMFKLKVEPLPYPEYYETKRSPWNPVTSELIPKYGLYAYEWPEGGKLLDSHKRWAVPMNYIAQWFSEENWKHIGSTDIIGTVYSTERPLGIRLAHRKRVPTRPGYLSDSRDRWSNQIHGHDNRKYAHFTQVQCVFSDFYTLSWYCL
ncbi:uncharacterized protein BDZ99DRAFT_136682 [Mytilinidion resinicola]|uniref:Uncharacterized protein n=1 Tax=Mytilinidion resinicola TaxID=574789 RepID=A0A6A6Z8E1_9PEZI|nr:uncharacterized protein BDZ99DRAFT_136682 [Mytilinidion resinicola]KAF2816467.1 hypothetical protein BDZ99DRAFT_136682 [Mytilinidion resinicola]